MQRGFGALRTSYEALIIFDMFNEVVARFDERISFGRLRDVRIDPKLVDEIINRMEVLSQYIDAHLHSDTYGSVKPTPSTLLDEIKAFESVRQRQRQLKKTTDAPAPRNEAQPAPAKPAGDNAVPSPIQPSELVSDPPVS